MLKTHRRESRRGHIIQAAVRPIVIVIHPPAIRNISQFTNTQKQLSIEQFISELAVERLDIAIFPGTAWGNIQGLYARFSQPFLNSTRYKLRSIVTADNGTADSKFGDTYKTFPASQTGTGKQVQRD